MDASLFEIVALCIVGVFLLIEVVASIRNPRIPSFRTSLLRILFYIGLAIAYFVSLKLLYPDTHKSLEFLSGWITEYSLSVDNLFIFMLIIREAKCPPDLQKKALSIGIVIALVARAIFISIGGLLLSAFSFVFVIFGAYLIWQGIKTALSKGAEEAPKDNFVIRYMKSRESTRVKYHHTFGEDHTFGKSIFKADSIWFYTPLLLLFLRLGFTDIAFATDSVPAIYGLTSDPLIVFATNLFALLGLQQLYFLIEKLLKKLYFLDFGLAAILVFIGAKLILEPEVIPGVHVEIDTVTSLIVIISLMVLTGVASWVHTKVSGTEAIDGA